MEGNALAIYQDFLDRTAEALLAGDAGAFLARIHLPHRIVTEAGVVDVPDRATAERHFEGFAGALRAQGVDAYIRIARSAVFTDPDRIAGQHVTHITSGGKYVAPEFENEMELERHDGVWGASYTRHHVRFVSWPDILPRPENP